MTRVRTQLVALLAGGLAASLLLTGCGASNDPADPSDSPSESETQPAEDVTLRFAWWGNDTRNALTEEVIAKFEAKYPNIKVEGEPTDWNSYFTKLSTQIGSGDSPDIIQMDEKYLAEYADKGALLDLESINLDTSKFAPGTIDPGRFAGTLYAATFAVNAPIIIANPSVFEQAGVAVPNDTTWTWQQLATVAAEVSAKGAGAYYGAQSLIGVDGAAKIWIRQNGGQQFTDDGIGFDAATIQPWFQYWLDLQAAGGTPPATMTIEDQTKAIDQSLNGMNQTALGFQWSNQISALQNATGQELRLLRPPTVTGLAADGELWYKSSMYLSAAASTQHPDEVKLFIEYILNDPAAGAILGTERGIPVNTDVRTAIQSNLSPVDLKVVEFMDSIAGELGSASVVPLPGGGQSETIQRRATDAVLLGSLSPADAAAQFVTELKAEMGVS